MSPIVFFLTVEQIIIFAAGFTLKGHEADMFQALLINYFFGHFCFLQDLSLMRCSLSIFFGFGSRITMFIG